MTIHASIVLWSLKLKPTPFPWSRSINTSRNIETTARATQQSDQVNEVQTVFQHGIWEEVEKKCINS